MVIDNAIDAVILLLELDPILDCAQVIPDVHRTGGLHSTEEGLGHVVLLKLERLLPKSGRDVTCLAKGLQHIPVPDWLELGAGQRVSGRLSAQHVGILRRICGGG